MMHKHTARCALALGLSGLSLLWLAGCGWQNPTWQTYEEVTTSSPSAHTHATAPAQAAVPRPGPLQWTAPESWSEEAGTGMRLVTFTVGSEGATGVCTIVRLGGAAGGLEANVRRWLGQLNVPEPPAEEWAAFLAGQEHIHAAGGFEGVLVDLTTLGAQTPEAASMLAGLLKADEATLFVKFTGSRALLSE